MKIGVLTSSRADFGIYLPLLQEMNADAFFKLEIIAFGTHLSKSHGFTIDEIEKEGFLTIHRVNSILDNDDENSISSAFALTALKFADFWSNNTFDLVFCLGDRFEMAGAVQAGIPFGVFFAHIHGGETTLGAIDNIYRHQITLASKLHLPATEIFAQRVAELVGGKQNIFTVGSLSIDGLKDMPVPSELDFRAQFNITHEFALLTFHPETISPELNQRNAKEMYKSLKAIANYISLVITMPNADTYGSVFRKELEILKSEMPDKILLIENFGKLNYFSAMKYCKLLIGNTSSGIIEAASFGKYVINVGKRQAGRLQSENVFNCDFSSDEIESNFHRILTLDEYQGKNIYQKKGTVETIVKLLKDLV